MCILRHFHFILKVVEESAVRQVKEEVQIQRICGHFPFIVNCPLHWQSRKRLYIGEFLKDIASANLRVGTKKNWTF